MRFSTVSFFALSGFASQALATVFVTNPIAGTQVTAGQPFVITWQNNGDAPNPFGNAAVDLYVGSTNIQAIVQNLSPSVLTSNVTSLNVTIDPKSGGNSNGYFLRFTSTTAQDPNHAGSFAEAFSAMFTVSGMTGQFNAAQQQAIASVNDTTSLSTSTSSSAAPAAAAPQASTPSKIATSASKPAGSASTTTSPSAKPSNTTTNDAVSTGIRMSLFGAVVLSGVALSL